MTSNQPRRVQLFDHRLTTDPDGTPLGVKQVPVGDAIENATPTPDGGFAGWVNDEEGTDND